MGGEREVGRGGKERGVVFFLWFRCLKVVETRVGGSFLVLAAGLGVVANSVVGVKGEERRRSWVLLLDCKGF